MPTTESEMNDRTDTNTGNMNTGNRNTGNWNTGDWNTGNMNTGNMNTGNMNTGNRNTGNWNTGDWNTGNWNTGNRNTGNMNTGNMNTGNMNTGNMNTGNRNTGNWNTGDWNTGYFNRDTPKTVRVFEKEIDREVWESTERPDFLYFQLTDWVLESDMSDAEKETHKDTYGNCGGYLKSYTYQEAFRKSWSNAGVDDRKKVLSLPGFDNEIFRDISGIDVEKELVAKEVVVNGKTYVLKEGE